MHAKHRARRLPLFRRPGESPAPPPLNTPTTAVAELRQASVTADQTPLLAPVSCQVHAGQIMAVRGENGAGKTTLLKLLAGHTIPTSGTVQVCGESPSERDAAFRRRVAALIGLPPMASDLTVFDHVALISATWHPEPRRAQLAAEQVLAELKLTALATRYPHELSSGQTQLFALAFVLVRPSRLLLLDEPEQRLDPGRVDMIAQALLARRAQGAAIVVATHSERLTRQLADHSLTLEAAA
ncbi:ABC-type multidrug transport system ATPase subunit [Leucobacter exalbidus]|uniref:ABC-type multidrug transport system ATPase subunit n=1 Tax=Leucobacter exalbidus TaxID=662960 RepID=A0A940PTF7_9MICO|nr:ABC transporter ATP-binding protein [Leucobacter exalbidus]MBP1324921.1 ABC-type multidrug transport system ATPase subunit [Leucobacter exalbidus]